ncbi:MAG: protease HtpX [Myxococcota bacterium]
MARAWPLRITLFVLTNLAVLLVFGVVLSLTGVSAQFGMSTGGLLLFAALFGFGGSLVSLAMSKQMALWSTGAKVLRQPSNTSERWLVDTVSELAQKSGIGMPDVAVWDSPVANAFATGARRNHALVAVSTGLLRTMRPEEVKAVLAHEVAHVANGDMVTMSMLQGVMNVFVIVLSRVVGSIVDGALSQDEDRGPGMGYFLATIVAQILFGVLASIVVMWFSRRREFRADAGAAELVGPAPMIAALQRLKGNEGDADLPQDLAAFGINQSQIAGLFSSHPPLDDRIAALRAS